VARERVTGVLLVGGASRRFGSPKALARVDGETLAERAWRTLGEACDERIAVGKAADALPLPFPVVDDGAELRAAIVGVAAGLRLAPTDLCLIVPVDLPDLTSAALEELAAAADDADAAVPQTGPLPGAYRRSVLQVLERRIERGELTLRDAVAELDARTVEVDTALLRNVNVPADLG
jgi:molybdopterin-guanine dinucleotide biosynthesis protein A